MRSFFKSAGFKVLLAFLAFLIGIMIYAVTKGGYAVSGESFINTITKPFRSVSNNISMKIESSLDKMNNADKYYEENQELKKQISELNKQLAEYDALKEEAEELKKFVTIKEEHEDYVIPAPCKVLGYTTNDPFMSFTINKGSADGILPDCPVVTAENLIGITTEVSEHMSTVETILSPDLSIAAVCASSTGDYGIVEGSVASALEGRTRLVHLPKDNQLKKGDLMVTTGTSGLFPKGYALGTVESIGYEETGLSMYAELEPGIDITRLSSVFVITDFSGKKDYSDED